MQLAAASACVYHCIWIESVMSETDVWVYGYGASHILNDPDGIGYIGIRAIEEVLVMATWKMHTH